MRAGRRPLLLILLLLFAIAGACAREALPLAEDPALEKRMLAIADELRCLVCQNESLAASRADLAQDLKRQIREQLQAGKSDQDVIDYMVTRYGDFVRYRPPLKLTTLALWFGPFLLLGVGLMVLWRKVAQQRQAEVKALAPAQIAQAAQLLRDDHPS